MDYCQNSLPDCTIINFDPTTNPPCWVKDFPGALDPSNFETDPFITTYQLDRTCSGSATLSTVPSSSISPNTRPTAFSYCWNETAQTQYFGLTQVNVNTIDDCKTYCLNLPVCTVANFDRTTSPPCWVQTEAGPLSPDNVYPDADVTTYYLIRNCIGSISSTSSTMTTTMSTTSLTTGTDLCFTVRSSTQYSGLTPTSLLTERDCKNYCISLLQCTILDFVFRGSSTLCWVQDSAMVITEDNFYANTDVNNFRLNRTCLNILNTTTTVIPTQCTRWTQLPNQISLGGILQPFLTLVTCQEGCVAQSACIAIDFDSSFSQCYTHYDPADLITLYDSATANQFRLERNVACDSTTTGPTPPANCYTWTIIERKNSINGLPQPSLNNLALCQIACTADSRCLAIDFDTNDPIMCWFHDNAADLVDLYDNPTNNQYLLTRNPLCFSPGSCFSWNEILGKISINGDLMPAYHTLDDCKNACIATASCLAIDYETLGSENCWFHSNPSNLVDLYDSTTANQFRLTRDPLCVSVTTPSTTSTITSSTTTATTTTTTSMTLSTSSGVISRSCVSEIFYNTNTPGGALVPGISSATDCWSYCLSTLSCVGVDYDSQYGCWQHNDLNNFVSNRKVNQSPGVIQYVISRNCFNPSVTQTSTTTTKPAPTSCVVFIYNNTNSIGGSLVMGISNSQACVDFCLLVPTCVGVDYDSQNGCWQHNNRINFDNNRKVGQSPFVVQYVVSTECTPVVSSTTRSSSTTITTTSSSTIPTCSGSFQILFNTSSIGASNENGMITPLACLFFCLENSNACAAIDFDSNTGCWVHLDRQQVLAFRRYPSNGVTQYVIERTCVTPLPFCSYQVLKNTYTVNGLLLTEVRGLTSCLNYCLITPSCVAVDYIDNGSCIAHSNIVYVAENRRYAPGLTQFLLNRVNCLLVPPDQTLNPLSTTTTTITTSTSLSSTSSLSTTSSSINPGCLPTWTVYLNTFSFGGTEQPQITDLNSCLDGCFRNSGCYAIDVTSPIFSCYFHLDPNFAANTYSGLPTQYRINRQCIGTGTIPGECQNFTTKPNTNSINGIHYFQITTASSCQTLCVNIPTCVAVDFDTQSFAASFGCWVHNSLQDLLPENTFPSEGVNQYILNRGCQGTCYYTWTPYPNNNMVGGIPQRDTTLDGCQARCVSIPECTGIDVDNRIGYVYCYLHVSTNLYLFPSPGVDHYQLSRSSDCPETITTPPPSTTTTNPFSSTSSCNVKMLLNMNSDGGQKLLEPMPQETCASRCVALYPQCVAADWRISDSICFLHSSLAGQMTSTCCVRYEIICTPNVGGVTCQDDFVINQYISPILQTMQYQPTINDVAQCQQACINYGQQCLAVVMSTVGRITPGVRSCYLVNSQSSLNTASSANDFDIYVRRFCSTNVPFSTTPFPTPSAGFCLLDIVFLVDTSGSILDNQSPGVNSMILVRSFISTFLTTTNDIGFYFDHVGIVTFDTTARVVYDLCDVQTPAAINASGIQKIVQSLGITNTPAGFDQVYNVLFTPTRCARQAARPVVVLITDAQTSPEFQSFYQGSLARLVNTGVTRIAIGITTDVNYDDLRQFASDPVKQTFFLGSYSQLGDIQIAVYNLMAAQCNRVPRLESEATTTTTTSTTTTTTSTTTSTTTTTTQNPSSNNQPAAFGAYLSSSIQGPTNSIRYDQLWAGTQFGYMAQISGFYSQQGLYFFDLGAGIASGRRVSLSLMIGSREVRILDWQATSFNGFVTASRFIVLYLDPGQFVSVRLNSDSYLTSDSNTKYSSFSGFNIAGSLTSYSNAYALVAEPNLPYYPYFGVNMTLPIISSVPSLSGNIVEGSKYVCPSSGIYFFTFSVGVLGNQRTRVGLVGLNPRIEITSLSSNRNAVTTLSRSALMSCNKDTSVTYQLISGAIADRNLTSFSAVLLQSSGQGQNHVWAAYKSYSSDTNAGSSLDPFYFDLISVNPNSLFDTINRNVRITLAGYYYIQVTAGVQIGYPVHMRLVLIRDSTATNLIYLTSEATNNNGEEFLSHGLVTRLNSGDTLKVVADLPSYIYNTEVGYQTSFIGFYLYP